MTSLKIRYKKWENGYIYGSTDFKDICLFSLIMTNKKQENVIENCEQNDYDYDEEVINNYNNVLEELG